jgi:hypothetical protein
MGTGSPEYRTLSLSLDGNIPFGFRDGDWISAGINIVKDKSGDTGYQHGFNGLSVAYHLALGKKQNTILTLGGKYGKYSKGPKKGNYISGLILANDAATDFDLNSLNAGGSAQSDQILNETNDFMLGLLLSAPMGDNADLRIGVASDHLFAPRLRSNSQPDTSMVPIPNQPNDRLDRRLNIVVQYYVDLNDKITFNPSIVYQKMGGASNILIQNLFSYHLPKKDDLALNFGIGYRLANNAVLPFYLGADFNDWRVGMSYGINMGGLSGAGREGGFELGLSKIFSWDKKAKVKPIFVCPRL